MRIPEIITELHKLAEDFSIPRLHDLADELKRRKTKKRAERVAVKITPVLKAAIRLTAIAQPDLPQVDIAKKFGVNQGRVSEILHGKRQ